MENYNARPLTFRNSLLDAIVLESSTSDKYAIICRATPSLSYRLPSQEMVKIDLGLVKTLDAHIRRVHNVKWILIVVNKDFIPLSFEEDFDKRSEAIDYAECRGWKIVSSLKKWNKLVKQRSFISHVLGSRALVKHRYGNDTDLEDAHKSATPLMCNTPFDACEPFDVNYHGLLGRNRDVQDYPCYFTPTQLRWLLQFLSVLRSNLLKTGLIGTWHISSEPMDRFFIGVSIRLPTKELVAGIRVEPMLSLGGTFGAQILEIQSSAVHAGNCTQLLDDLASVMPVYM